MTRKLASIQRITEINSIEGADQIVVASVLGWRVVVKKDEFKVGDLGVYFEVDSLLPARPEFEFLKDRGYRIRTIKLRKQISQGLFMPLSILPVQKKWKDGDDVTDIIGVTKYDPEGDIEKSAIAQSNPIIKFLMRFSWYRKVFAPKKKAKGFPSFARKTDEDRVQLFPRICDDETGTPFIVTEKLDGQSATYALERKGYKYDFKVCSRNLINENKESSYWRIADKLKIESSLRKIADTFSASNVVLQGEIVGDGIQGNKYGLKGIEFYAFNLFVDGERVDADLSNGIFLTYHIKSVPYVDKYYILPSTIDELVQFSNAKSVLANTLREGIVVRNYEKGISFKVINPEFLLKWKL